MHEIFIALSVTLLAGLATVIGGILVLFFKQPSYRVMAFGLAFSAGAMIYVSLTEILTKSVDSFSHSVVSEQAFALGTAAFFVGMIAIILLDRFIPNPHIMLEDTANKLDPRKLNRVGMLTLFAITAHNLPEGLATFFATLESPTLGAPLAVAIAIHNIPEGIAIALPVYMATQSKKSAFIATFISGLAEPVGAILGYAVLAPIMSDLVYGWVFGIIGGVMVFLALDELLPTAKQFAQGHETVYGLVSGMGVLAFSLVLLNFV
ncbi:MAG: zinc transporter ZupT [Acinetobacter sp.]|nr:zinc transporter ZupT [Acinetobacter sp.]